MDGFPGIGIDGYVMVGANHKRTPLAVRDCLALDDPAVDALLAHLRDHGLLEAVVLSTCDRVEICAYAEHPDRVRDTLKVALCDVTGVADLFTHQMLDLQGEAVVRHFFRIASSLESRVIGEPHVLGQVKAAHRQARDAGLAGPAMETLLQAAYGIAKRVRSETPIAEGPVSLAASAVQVARDLHGDLSQTHLLLMGTEEMGELIAEHLLASGVGTAGVTNSRWRRALGVAERLGAEAMPFEQVMASLESSDIVIVAMAGSPYALGEDAVRASLRRRRNRPMFLIDVGVPGHIEPAVDRLQAAFVYDLADLELVAQKGRASRDEASLAASLMVEEAVRAFLRHRVERQAVPAIMALRALFDVERRRALDEAPDDAEKATRLLVGRLLHVPSAVLRTMAGGNDETRDQAEAMLRQLFALSMPQDENLEKDEALRRELGRKIGPGCGPT